MNQKLSRRAVARTIAEKLLAEPQRKDHWLKVLAAYMIENNMAEDVDLFVNDIASEIFESSGKLLVDVQTARPLSESVRTELAQVLKSFSHANQVVLSEQIDKSLLGGLVARTPDAELDLSVRSKLERLATIK